MSRLEERIKLYEILTDMIENLEDNWGSHEERSEGINDVLDELLNRRENYARECSQASLEKASENGTSYLDGGIAVNGMLDKESITNPENIILL